MIAAFSIAAATAVLGYDLMSANVNQVSGKKRRIRSMALTGSAAAGDTKVDIYIDAVKIGELYNTATGFPNRDDYQPLGGAFVPPGAKISVIVTDAPASNPINGYMEIDEVK